MSEELENSEPVEGESLQMEKTSPETASEPILYEDRADYDPVLEPAAARNNQKKAEAQKPPALTIQIASWATPIIGLLMLVIGLAGGFFLRPVLLPTQSPATSPEVAEVTNPTEPAETQAEQQTAQQPSQNDRDALMGAITPQVRHFAGNPEAPITLIEFSDFQ